MQRNILPLMLNYHLLDIRHREDVTAEEQVREKQGPEDIKRLGKDKCQGGSAVFHADQLAETCLKADRSKGQGKPHCPHAA